jgi:molybdate transport system ATP-binding protein
VTTTTEAGRTGGLHADLRVDLDRLRLRLELDVRPGAVLALLGPNGAGKSTALRCLAGLRALDGGDISLDGRCLDDLRRDVLVPARDRSVGMVFQDYLLFPHLSAVDNVAFGLRVRGQGRRQARSEALGWLDRMGLRACADERPSALSGGQAQRVALARALAPEPALLLLDEPLAALDATTRMQVRSDLRQHLSDYTGCTVLVSHDPLDAMVLADQLLVVEDGVCVQRGSASEVARAPRTDYVASLVGLNLYRGHARGSTVEVSGGGTLTTTASGEGPVLVTFPPSAVSLYRERPGGSPRNTWPGRVVGLEQHSATVRVQVAGAPPVLADVTTAAVAELGLSAGAPVWVAVKATEVSLSPA